MTASSLIIAADRGSLRAYRFKETPTRGSRLELIQAFEVTDVMNAVSIRHATPMTDWPQLEKEMDRRTCKELAREISENCSAQSGRRLVVRRARIDLFQGRRTFAA